MSAVLYIVVFCVIVACRISYPYELEWMEGSSVDHVLRILSGLQLYVEPDLQFVPFIYTPLYFYVSALFSKLLGIGFFPLRMVSFLSSLGCLVILFLFVRRETNSIECGTLSVGLYAATFKIGGSWFDIARVDSLFMLFLLCGIYVLRSKPSNTNLVLAGILTSLSFLTKQSALFVAIPLSIYCLLCLPKLARWVYPGTFLFLTGSTTLLFQWISGGWYYYYIFDLPSQHSFKWEMMYTFWTEDILSHLSAALAVSLLFLTYKVYQKRYDDFAFFFLLFVGMVGSSWLSRLHSGGYNNVLLPAYAVITLYFSLGIHILLPRFCSKSSDNKTRRIVSNSHFGPSENPLYQYLTIILCILFFASFYYNPLDAVPGKTDVDAGDAFVRSLQDIEGEALVLSHGFLPSLAGKKTHAHAMAMFDVLRGTDQSVANKLRNTIENAIHNKQFEAIILDGPITFAQGEFEKNYILERELFDNERVFWPVTGVKTRPNSLYRVR